MAASASGDHPILRRREEAADELAAELRLNAIVRSTLQGKVVEEVKPEKL